MSKEISFKEACDIIKKSIIEEVYYKRGSQKEMGPYKPKNTDFSTNYGIDNLEGTLIKFVDIKDHSAYCIGIEEWKTNKVILDGNQIMFEREDDIIERVIFRKKTTNDYINII